MFKAEKSALSAALASIKASINARNTIPILANALFERSGEDLMISGSNLDIQITATCSAGIAADFIAFTAPYALFETAVKSMTDGPITVENVAAAGGRIDGIAIKSGRARIKMPILPAQDYPKMKTDKLNHGVGLGVSSLKQCFRAVEFAMSTEETRYYLNGVFMHTHPEGLMFVATDGARLARRLMPMVDIDEEKITGIPAVIIPSDTVKTVSRLLPDAGNVAVRLSDERIEFALSGLTIVSKLVEGTFPDYQRITPANNDKIIRLNGKLLAGAVGRVLTVNNTKGSGIRFTFADGAVRLVSKPGENGEAEDEMSADVEGNLEIGFNGSFMLEVIDSLGSGDIEMKLGNPGDPAMIMRPSETNSFAILMPMRI